MAGNRLRVGENCILAGDSASPRRKLDFGNGPVLGSPEFGHWQIGVCFASAKKSAGHQSRLGESWNSAKRRFHLYQNLFVFKRRRVPLAIIESLQERRFRLAKNWILAWASISRRRNLDLGNGPGLDSSKIVFAQRLFSLGLEWDFDGGVGFPPAKIRLWQSVGFASARIGLCQGRQLCLGETWIRQGSRFCIGKDWGLAGSSASFLRKWDFGRRVDFAASKIELGKGVGLASVRI